ncbi:MAG: TAXI family TRAP transporter solute-binding subunit [Acidobacteriota bacterium]
MASDRESRGRALGPEESGRDSSDKAASRWELVRLWGPIALLAIAAFAYTFTRLEPPAPRQLTLATGGQGGAYFGYGQAYGEHLARFGFELEVLETAGSVENLALLEAGEVDLALLQGGVTDPETSPDLEVLGSLFFEPFWVFYRADAVVERLTDLSGKRLAIGPEGSGTRVLAKPLLADNDVDEGNTTLLPLAGAQAAQALEAGEVDAVFFVASAEASYVERLLGAEGIELLSLRRYRAYKVRHPFLSPVILGEGVIDLDDNLPPRDVQMVAAASTLAARKNLHHALVPVLVEAMENVHGGPDLFSEAGRFPSHLLSQLPVKQEAAHYLENGPSFLYRILPYRTATTVDRLKILLLPFIPLLLVVFKMAPPVYRWRIRSRIYRWYEDLRELDSMLLASPSTPEVRRALHRLDDLEKEITEVTVPLSYMDEFYNLRMHVKLIDQKLLDLLVATRKGDLAADAGNAEVSPGDGEAPGA